MTPICIDSCPVAASACFGNLFAYTPWYGIPECENLHINFKEVLALEPAIQEWFPHLANKKVIVHCDNQAAVAIINPGSYTNPVVSQSLRRIFWWSVIYNFRLLAIYIPGKSNVLADAVSILHECPRTLSELNLTPVLFVSPQVPQQAWKPPSTAKSSSIGSRLMPPPLSVHIDVTRLPILPFVPPWDTPPPSACLYHHPM